MATAELTNAREAGAVPSVMIDVPVVEVKKRPGTVTAAAVMLFVWAGIFGLLVLAGGKGLVVFIPVIVVLASGLLNLKAWARTGGIVCACLVLTLKGVVYVGTGMVHHDLLLDMVYFGVILGLLNGGKAKAAAWN